jgi:hypothetical protein
MAVGQRSSSVAVAVTVEPSALHEADTPEPETCDRLIVPGIDPEPEHSVVPWLESDIVAVAPVTDMARSSCLQVFFPGQFCVWAICSPATAQTLVWDS